jgi:hydrogenase maturation protease
MSGWDEIRAAAPRTATVDGVEVRRGSRVRLRPRAGADVFDIALAGRAAVVERLECDLDGVVQLAVTLEDDPGQDLGAARQPGHRFFYALDEVEPLPGGATGPRILLAGIGNGFLGDDGFGVELARRLMDRPLPDGVEVKDFGIRGMDLAFALAEYDAVVLLDAVPRGQPPGTVSVIEPDDVEQGAGLDAHGMDPVRVLSLARELGPMPERVLLVGCEPLTRMTGDEDEVVAELTPPVQAALDPAVRLVEELLDDLTKEATP